MSRLLVVAASFAFASAVAAAADPVPGGADETPAAAPPPAYANLDAQAAAPDTSGWSCRFCKVETGASGWIEPALGYVWKNGVRFSDYRARDDEGLQPDLAGQYRYRAADSADFLDAQVERLGLESRGADISGGRQGRYRVVLGFHSIPYVQGEGATPFRGDNLQTLPPGWTRAGSTGGMTDLASSLHGVTLDQRRDRLALGFAVTPQRALDVRFDFHRDAIRGARAMGASFMTLDSQLARPLHQTLDRMDLSAAYRTSLGTGVIALDSSSFVNDYDELRWANPYNSPSAGADTGQLALPPDNRAHRISVTLGSAPTLPVQLTGQFALGRMLQDEPFLPATVNPNLAVALPRASLDGRVDTTLASVRASASPWRSLRVSADFLHDDRDNKTPVASYTQIVMDTFNNGARLNVPYGFTRDRWRVSVERVAAPRLAVGFDDDSRERHLVGALDSHEQTTWARLGWRPLHRADVHLRVAHAERDGADRASGASENPLQRAYQASDRKRDELRGDVSVPLSTWGTGSVNASYGRNRYPVQVGRTRERQIGYGGELAVQPFADWTATVFAARDQMSTAQANSQAFATPDWFADQDDVTTTAGLSVARHPAQGLDLGADYVYSQFEGNVYLTSGTLPTVFPALVSRLQDSRVYAGYPVRPGLQVRLDLLYQRFEGRDWALDGVGPATLPNVLALGTGAGSGEAGAAILSLRYSFSKGDAAAESGD